MALGVACRCMQITSCSKLGNVLVPIPDVYQISDWDMVCGTEVICLCRDTVLDIIPDSDV